MFKKNDKVIFNHYKFGVISGIIVNIYDNKVTIKKDKTEEKENMTFFYNVHFDSLYMYKWEFIKPLITFLYLVKKHLKKYWGE